MQRLEPRWTSCASASAPQRLVCRLPACSMLPALAAPCARCSPRSLLPAHRCSLRSLLPDCSPLFDRSPAVWTGSTRRIRPQRPSSTSTRRRRCASGAARSSAWQRPRGRARANLSTRLPSVTCCRRRRRPVRLTPHRGEGGHHHPDAARDRRRNSRQSWAPSPRSAPRLRRTRPRWRKWWLR